MERPVSHERPSPANEERLTPLRQRVLDCAVCFSVRFDTVTGQDIAQCQELEPRNAAQLLGELANGGYTELTGLSGKRKLYQPTERGVSKAGEELDPLACQTQQTARLNKNGQAALDCASCLDRHDAPISRQAFATCIGSIDIARVGFKQLIDRGYIISTSRGMGSKPETFALADTAPTSTNALQSCKIAAVSAEKPLMARESKVLDCMRCQVAQGVVPDSIRLMDCTNLDRVQIFRAVRRLMSRGVIVASGSGEVSLRSNRAPQTFRPSDMKTFSPKVSPACRMADNETLRVYRNLSDERKHLLGCLACIDGKVKAGASMPGSSVRLLVECSGLPEHKARSFLKSLCMQKYFTKQTGFSITEYGRHFYEPTANGGLLMSHHRSEDVLYNKECALDLTEVKSAPQNIRNEIIKCVGCIWTQQVASGQKPAVTSTMLSTCTGLSSINLRNTILPELTEAGYLQRRKRKIGTSHIYHPSRQLRVTMGYAADCKLNLHDGDITEFLAATPDSTIARPDDDTVFREFNDYVDNLKLDTEAISEGFKYLTKMARSYGLLTAEQEAFLAMIIQKSPDKALVDKAVQRFALSNIRLAIWMTKRMRYEVAITSFEDVAQSALIGIYEAVRRFSPSIGGKFSTYAFYWMRQQVQRDTARLVGVPSRFISLIPVTLWRIHDFHEEQGRLPNLIELAGISHLTVKKIQEMMEVYKYLGGTFSLNASGPYDSRELQERIGNNDTGPEQIDTLQLFDTVRPYLKDYEEEILDSIIMRKDLAPGKYAQNYGIAAGLARLRYQQVASLIRHPYFAIGATLSPQTLGWQREGLCRTQGVDAVVVRGERVSMAGKICDGCPVYRQCADLSQASPLAKAGIWAGKKYK